MNEKIWRAIAWEADKADFTANVRDRILQGMEQPGKVPRFMLCNRRKLFALVASLLCVLALAGFTAATIFSKLFEAIPYHDIVVDYKSTREHSDLIGALLPGDVATKVIDERNASTLYKYFKGDSFDLESYGENKPDGGFMLIPIFHDDVPDILLSINTTDRTPTDYRQQGRFSFELANPAYRLVEATENRSGLYSLVYDKDTGGRITVQTIYKRYQDTRDELDYRPEYTTINGRSFMFLEIEDSTGVAQELFCFLGDDKLAPGLALSGMPKEDLLEAASCLVLYNEDTNIPGAVPKTPEDLYSRNADPLLAEHADEILAAVGRALKNSVGSTAWSSHGREIYVDPSEYAAYDIQIYYSPQAWAEVNENYQIPAPPLSPYGWTGDRPVKGVVISYRNAGIEEITLAYADGSGWDALSAYPLDEYHPKSQLDATLIAFLLGAAQIPDELLELDHNHYLSLQLANGETLIYTAVLNDHTAWGFRYTVSDEN